METDKLEALLKAATPGPWRTHKSKMAQWDDIGILAFCGCVAECFSEIRRRDEGAHQEQAANAALIAAAPDLAAEVLRLRAEQSQTVAANAALAAENARLRDFIQELVDAKPEVVKSPVDGEGYIEASYFWDWQSDAGKALAGKAGA